MPSRKKAQGKARKEKRATQRSNNIGAASNPAKNFIAKCNTTINVNGVSKQASIDKEQLIIEVYNEYCQFNDNGIDRLILAVYNESKTMERNCLKK